MVSNGSGPRFQKAVDGAKGFLVIFGHTNVIGILVPSIHRHVPCDQSII